MLSSHSDARGMPPNTWMGLIAGFALAIVACGGILAQRLSRGDLKLALVGHVFLTLAVLGVAKTEARPSLRNGFPSKLVAQLLGGALGILVAHYVLRSSAWGAMPWLSERPAQFMNDAVAVFAPLAVVWASSRRPPNTAVLVCALLLVTAYRMTGFMWHLDSARFSFTVQDFVTGEFAGSVLGVAAFRLLVPA